MRRRARGFTMVELLIVMTLLGLLSLGLVGGLRFGTRAWEAGTRQAAGAGRVELAQNLLRRQLAQPLVAPGGNAEVSGAFDGDGAQLVFVAPWLAQVGGGGATAFQLSVEESEKGRNLVLRWFPFNAEWDGSFPEDPERRRVIVSGLEEVSFTYYGRTDDQQEADWSDTWRDQRALPNLVAIEGRFLEDAREVWPRLVIAPKTAAAQRQ